MAFESANYQGTSRQNDFCPTVYGASLSNSDSSIDKTNLNFSMWQKTLKITISPLVEGIGNESRIDFKNGLSIYLSPTKALMFADILKKYRKDPKTFSNHGVPSGQGLITIAHPSLYNKGDNCGPIINIKKIAQEGNVEQSYSYELKQSYNSVVGFNDSTGKFKQDYESYVNIELDMIIVQIEEYVKAMTNATAFSNLVAVFPYLDKIASKLGTDLTERRKFSGGSYLTSSNSSGVISGHASLESMMQG